MGYLQDFIASLPNANTQSNFKSQLTELQKAFGNLLKVTGPELKQYFLEMRKSAKPATINSKLTSARAFYRWAIDMKLIRENPTEFNLSNVSITNKQRVNELNNKILENIQVEYIINAAKNNLRDLCILLFIFNTAARRSEVVKLTRNEFQAALRSKKIILHGKGKNGGKDRFVAFTDKRLIKLVKDYLKSRTDENEYLFVSRLNKNMTGKAIENIVKKYMLLANAKWPTKCDIPKSKMAPHNLRHTAIFEYWKNTKDPKGTMDFAGHDSFNTTLIYTNLTDYDEQGKGVDKFAWNQ